MRAIDADEPNKPAGSAGNKSEDNSASFSLEASSQSAGLDTVAPSYLSAIDSPTTVQAFAPSNRYEILEIVGRGGMGVVYRVIDRNLNRELAMKVLRSDVKISDEVLGRFRREARITGWLQHPGIPPVVETGIQSNGHPYFTMKLVRGSTLATAVSHFHSNSTPTDVLDNDVSDNADIAHDQREYLLTVLRSVVQTVAYAHSHQVIHRDLKPGNIMMGTFGEVQVMDWGMSKVLQGPNVENLQSDSVADRRESMVFAEPKYFQNSDSTAVEEIDAGTEGSVSGNELHSDLEDLGDSRSTPQSSVYTRHGAVLGTPAYMAPEQARGDIDRVDARADVFSLGAILCEILTGCRPFDGMSAANIIGQSVPLDLTKTYKQLNTCGADEEIILLTQECLAIDPKDRPQSAQEVAIRLNQRFELLNHRLQQARVARARAEVEANERKARQRLRNMLVSLVALMMLAGFAAAIAYRETQFRRQVALAESQSATIDRIELLLSQAALRRDSLQWETADSLIRTAESEFELLENAASSYLSTSRVRSTKTALEVARVDLDAANKLDQLLYRKYELFYEQYDNPENDSHTAAMLNAYLRDRYGVEAGVLDLNAQSLRDSLGNSPLLPQIVLALDDWGSESEQADIKSAVLAQSMILDPESRRSEIRSAMLSSDKAKLEDMARQGIAGKLSFESMKTLALGPNWDENRELLLELLDFATRLDPTDIRLRLLACYHLQFLLEQPGTLQRIMDHASAAAAIRPNNASALYYRAYAYSLFENYAMAEKIYARLLEVDPNDMGGRENRTACLIELGLYGEAAENLWGAPANQEPEKEIVDTLLGKLEQAEMKDWAVKITSRFSKIDMRNDGESN